MIDALLDAGPARWTAAALALVAWLALCVGTIARERRRARDARRERERMAAGASSAGAAADAASTTGSRSLLIAYASQTGTAESLAWASARLLGALGAPVQLLPMAELTMPRLQAAGVALFVTSTYGEGDPPDNASSFVGRLLEGMPTLDALSYAVLALGDRQYANFCSFGHQLAGWLRERGGRPLFDTIEVDNQDGDALRRWQAALTALVPAGGASRPPGFAADAAGPAPNAAGLAGNAQGVADDPLDLANALPVLAFERWTVTARERLNAGEAEHPLFRIVLNPAAGTLPSWQAGDLALVRHPADAARPREYSIASLPADGGLELIVRQERHADGTLGLCSGLLTAGHPGGDGAGDGGLDVALRANRNFRLDGNERRPLILIGNGSGIAGLLALIRHARQLDSRGHWLIFGERDPAHDRPAHALIEGWLADGTLARADRVFSRGPSGREYVQHRLAAERQRLRDAIDAGAAIYVCGSAVGMAGGVDEVLRESLGSERVDALRDAGRYRRDVY